MNFPTQFLNNASFLMLKYLVYHKIDAIVYSHFYHVFILCDFFFYIINEEYVGVS